MRLFFDKRLRYFVTSPGQSGEQNAATVKAGDTERVEIVVGRSSDPAGSPGLFEAQEWVPEPFEAETNVVIILKAPGEYSDGDALALADEFEIAGEDDNVYVFELNLNTVEINAELNRLDEDNENDVASIAAGFEISYQIAGEGGWQSSINPFSLTINHDLYSGEEGTPSAAAEPALYLLREDGIKHYPTITGLTGGGATKLDSIPTADEAIGGMFSFIDETGTPILRAYRLEAGTAATSSPTVIRPTDYAATTNEKIFRLTTVSSNVVVNPMTTAGDIIVAGTSGTPTRLAKGANGTALSVSAGNVSWQPLPESGTQNVYSLDELPASILGRTIAIANATEDNENPQSYDPALAIGDGDGGWIYVVTGDTVAPAFLSFPHDLGYDEFDDAEACVLGSGTVYYSDQETLGVGAFLFEDEERLLEAPNGNYSDGTTWYQVTGGSGEITTSGSCS